jgi:hypothetical protein
VLCHVSYLPLFGSVSKFINSSKNINCLLLSQGLVIICSWFTWKYRPKYSRFDEPTEERESVVKQLLFVLNDIIALLYICNIINRNIENNFKYINKNVSHG